MRDWKSTSAEIQRLGEEQAVEFARLVAERASLVVDCLAVAATRVVVSKGLALLADRRNIAASAAEAAKLDAELKECLEASEDDSNKPSYYVMRGLGVLVAAIRSVRDATEAARWAEESGGLAANLASDLDWFLEQKRPTTDSESVESAELAAQIAALDVLTMKGDASPGSRNALDSASEAAKRMYATGMKAICSYYGWNG